MNCEERDRSEAKDHIGPHDPVVVPLAEMRRRYALYEW